MKFMIAALALICAIQISYGAPADEVDCGKIEEVFDEQGLASGLSLINDKYVRYTSKEEADKRCPEMSEAVKILKRYNSKCNTGLTQQVFSATFKTKQDYIDKVCKDTSSDHAKSGYESLKCLQENLKEQVKATEEKGVLTIQVLGETTFKNDKEKITRMCCTYVKQKADAIETIKTKCEKAVSFMNDYLDSYLSESLTLVCPDLDKLVKDGECDKLTPLSLEGVKPKYQFLLAPAIKIVKNLEQH